AACAAAVCAARTDRTRRRVTVNVPGGPLHIDWRANNHVIMTGPAEWEFSGTVDPKTGDWQADEVDA
ncbi:MAG: diaminopimelate epimerase, partial [Hoeflea sp.]